MWMGGIELSDVNKNLRKRTLSINTIIKMYKEGKSTTEIAKLSNISSRYVRMLLKKNEVKMRSHGSWKRKYSLNEDYFKVWSNNMAYILGFFCADGMIAGNAQLVSFSQKDKDLLINIKNEIDSDHPIIQNEHTGVYILNLNSKIMKSDLMTLHNQTPNKSNTLKFPTIPKEYISHFIRGYFDGDGYVNYKSFFVSFVGGSKEFMETLRGLIEDAGFETNFTDHDNYFRVYVSGRKTIKLFSNWMYRNKGSLYLKRKHEEFQKEMLPISQLRDRKYKAHKNALSRRRGK